jgi:acyl-CoA dehydrogenase
VIFVNYLYRISRVLRECCEGGLKGGATPDSSLPPTAAFALHSAPGPPARKQKGDLSPVSATPYQSPWVDDEVRLFRKTVRQFIQDEFVPHQARWREQHRPDEQAWRSAGTAGILMPDLPEEFGGAGGSFAHETVVNEELAYAGVHFGSNIQSIVGHYILSYGTPEQKSDWLPRLARGELVAAIAMTEPSAGSDLAGVKTAAIRDGDHYVLNGSKTFITNGWHASLICVAVKTDTKASGLKGISLVVVEPKDLPGYRVGRTLEKVGMNGLDTCEIFFDDVRIPAANLLGAEGKGFNQMLQQLPYERLSIGVGAVAMAEQAVALTTKYTKERTAFGKPLIEFQNTRFRLAHCKTEVHIGRVFLDNCIQRFIARQLDPVTAAMAKYWLTECQCRVVDECVQLHGGYGYMIEYPIARMWTDSRVQRIYAGTNEIMKELIGWAL